MSLYFPDELALWSGGEWSSAPSSPLKAVSTHSGEVQPGALFIALKGLNHDAHRFVPQAIAGGASAAMVRRDYNWPGGAGTRPHLLFVDNPNRALGEIAAGYRRKIAPVVVGITGSVGKTTVKEITAALLAALGPTARTPGNLNNEFGLPLSLLAMPAETRYGVFEIGMSNPGELAPLCEIMRPDHAIVTTIGPAHLEAFGEVEAIAREKSTLLRYIPETGIAALDRDEKFFDLLASRSKGVVVTVGSGEADLRLLSARAVEGTFTVLDNSTGENRNLAIGLSGEHNIKNALLAVAMARALGLDWEAIGEILPSVGGLPMRWEVSDIRGVRVINDAYNANPVSMGCALRTFSRQSCPGRRWAVLGDMLELGPTEEELHRELGTQAAGAGLHGLLLMGCLTHTATRQGAAESPNAPLIIRACANSDEAAEFLDESMKPGDALLLKGSRGMALERIVAALAAKQG